ncbi:co-chaperone GroES [Caldithrix abyssi]|uniref:Chaperonin Cpn10 n=1 Tax=Caldithrix abyssi DSM 13497 TaxID=880073 RepID=H1XRR4_CALAY|nr:co-chaperone GroES family protein [Caldithrix abyssi]APF17135.1 Co-chaperonin GroES (HSP10) [Caldithrix abyssi DSM 13497]EHO41274.1 Chaperonin Cpn10 [Caldithrix abyssi DSM 13497]
MIEKKIIVVGDRVLIQPDESRSKTAHGLYLPQGVHEKEKVQAGFVVKVGPGYPLADPANLSDEPWGEQQSEPRYIPLQVEEGDYAIFMRKAAIEVEIDDQKYVIVPQSAILLVIREELIPPPIDDEETESD